MCITTAKSRASRVEKVEKGREKGVWVMDATREKVMLVLVVLVVMAALFSLLPLSLLAAVASKYSVVKLRIIDLLHFANLVATLPFFSLSSSLL